MWVEVSKSMVNQKVVDYLCEGMRRGFSLNLLKQKLLERGFSESDVNEAVAASVLESQDKREMLVPQQQQSEQRVIVKKTFEHIGVFHKIGKSIAHPHELFEKTKEEGEGPAFQYHLIISFVPFILGVLLIVLFVSSLLVDLEESFISLDAKDVFDGLSAALGATRVLFVMSYALIIFIIIPLFMFLVGLFMHLFVKLYGGSGQYGATYSTCIYSLTPSVLFTPVTAPWSFVLMLYGLSIKHDISKWRAFFVLLSSMLLIAIILLGIFVIGLYFDS